MRIVTKKRKFVPSDDTKLEERIVLFKRVSRTQKGGRRQRIFVLAVVGDKQGHVGASIGKAHELPDALRKAVNQAKKNMIEVPLLGNTIPHAVIGEMGATKVLLKPASPGTGTVAGRAVRAVVELAGIKDILTKCIGSTNPVNVVWATLKALSSLQTPEEVARKRGKHPYQLLPWLKKMEVEKLEEDVSAEVKEEPHRTQVLEEENPPSSGIEESEPGGPKAEQSPSGGDDRESERPSGSEDSGD
jgi:small subunit ribosomal protein S5